MKMNNNYKNEFININLSLINIMDNKLSILRSEIEEIDSLLLDLLCKRLNISKEIGIIKKENNLPIFDETREKELIQKLIKKNKINSIYLEHFWNELFFISRCIQKDIIIQNQ